MPITVKFISVIASDEEDLKSCEVELAEAFTDNWSLEDTLFWDSGLVLYRLEKVV